MNIEEKIKKLYEETYEDENINDVSIEEMKEALESYYSVAGFEIKSVEDLFENKEINPEFVKAMEDKIEEALKSVKS